MNKEIGWDQIKKHEQSLVTVGTFDGVHVGHQAIMKYLVERAENQGLQSVAVTFDPHPRQVVRNIPVPLLTTVEERAEVLERLGVDRFIVIPFTLGFAETSAEAFVTDVLVNRIGLQEIIIGHDHGFGKGRTGDKEVLKKLGERFRFSVDVMPVQLLERDIVSSTRLRQALQEEGDVALATRLLGRYYSVKGTVVEGDGRGSDIGFPTANIHPDHRQKVIPRTGVYAVQVHVPGYSNPYKGMLNIGYRPTFGGRDERIEVHLFEFSGILYGENLQINFVQRIRDEKKFNSVNELIQQLSKDKERCIAELESVT